MEFIYFSGAAFPLLLLHFFFTFSIFSIILLGFLETLVIHELPYCGPFSAVTFIYLFISESNKTKNVEFIATDNTNCLQTTDAKPNIFDVLLFHCYYYLPKIDR